MKNDLKRQCFNLSVSFPPFIKGERGLTVLLSNRQNNFWTCHFFTGVNLILSKLLKISNDIKKKKPAFWKSNPQVDKQTSETSYWLSKRGLTFRSLSKCTKNGHFLSVLCRLNRSHFIIHSAFSASSDHMNICLESHSLNI